MRELTEGEKNIEARVVKELVGLSFEEAKEIIKHVLVVLNKLAVIGGGKNERP